MGSVVVSVDAELGWGFLDLHPPPADRIERCRRGWHALREAFEAYDVPATWAVVGHLMLEDCDGRHVDHPAPAGWFERERTDWKDRPDLRFGPDLVRSVLESPVDHEFASHSFSHVLFGAPSTDRELARAEFERALDLADEWGLECSSFVYPRNNVGHRAALAEAGFTAYRGRTSTPEGFRAVLETGLGGRSVLVEPTVDEHGLVNVPASLFCFGFESVARTVAESVWTDPMVVTARRAIDQAVAADDDRLCHLWLHPNNLTTDRDDERMRAILAYIDQQRRETDLTVETMDEVAARVGKSAEDADESENADEEGIETSITQTVGGDD
ncbi:polysaccharide deacetylase family protein [Natronosalvus caseinilyticus]|uniref:polysaccharide deacetylase family protein n=1 Tax=Natronosalvus caseinilyticus TaxID=2953747 RepID=UPI0028A700FA|nr:polysaccharide deacetylase family protein [Natronosalvus caseinilyticus]